MGKPDNVKPIPAEELREVRDAISRDYLGLMFETVVSETSGLPLQATTKYVHDLASYALALQGVVAELLDVEVEDGGFFCRIGEWNDDAIDRARALLPPEDEWTVTHHEYSEPIQWHHEDDDA